MLINRVIKSKNGSALLLTLMILSLMLVVVLSLVVFVRLQLREVTNHQNLRIARQNARLGLELAISELQKYAGADQRITAPATTVFPAKDFNELYDGDADEGSSEMFSLYRDNAQTSSARSYLNQVATYTTPAERRNWEADLRRWWNDSGANPHWVGVFNSSLRIDRSRDPANPGVLPPEIYELNPDTIYGEPNRNQLPVWLISGNEQLNFNPLTDSSYPTDYLTPVTVLPDPTDANSDTVWMVGEGSATVAANSVDGLDGRVKAPKQQLQAGHYAYWVGDESLKANFAVREPDEYAAASRNTVEYRNRLQVPQRVGWERMTNFAEVFDANPGMDVNDPNFAKLISQKQIPLIHSDFSDGVKENFHHITSSSVSLLTDTSLGGLKKDLTQYLEHADGMSDNDSIADPERYNPNDSRFAAYDGFNSGFPNSSDAALDGIPTWGQLRDWYRNESVSGGSIDPDPASGVAPVISYLHFNCGISYDPGTKMVRIHWAPLVTLWNPYDVRLKPTPYNLDLGLPVVFNNCLFVNPTPELSELQDVNSEAEWQVVTLAPPEFFGPGGKKVLLAQTRSDGTVEVKEVDTAGTYTVFKADLSETALTIPDGDKNDRFFVKIDVASLRERDQFNISQGPWVMDNDISNGTTDAFGALYYATRPGQDKMMFFEKRAYGKFLPATNTIRRGALGTKKIFTYVVPNHGGDELLAEALPLDRQMMLRISSGFEPGEVKVFTLPGTTEWIAGQRMSMVNDYDPDLPQFTWMNLVELVGGPDSAESNGLKFFMQMDNSSPARSQGGATIHFSTGSDTIFKTDKFGEIEAGKAWELGQGREYRKIMSFGKDANGVIEREKDFDGDGLINGEEDLPHFISTWRNLYDEDSFEDHIRTQSGSETVASNWSFGESFLTPFSGSYEVGSSSSNSVHLYFPVFSRFNLGAKDFNGHPLVEQTREPWTSNNLRPNGLVEGLSSCRYQKGRSSDGMGGSSEVKWDNFQVKNSQQGYVLAAYRDQGGSVIQGLSTVAIRNARRAESEVLSIGQFQQVNLSPYFWQPSFPIGHGDASPYVDREAIAGIHSRMVGAGKYINHIYPGLRPNHARPQGGKPQLPLAMFRDTVTAVDGALLFDWKPGKIGVRTNLGGNTMLDLGYVLNENIWDRFFLSTLTSDPTDLSNPLPNARMRFNDHAASAADLTDFDLGAAYLNTVGSLNVNSTSVEAWKALLTAFRDLELGAPGDENPPNTVPVTRTLEPIAERVSFHFNTDAHGARVPEDFGAVGLGKDYTQVLSGFRYLDDEMIEALAERIVDEVRLRGPFYSLSDFVNRRLAPPAGSNQPGSPWHDARTDGLIGGKGNANQTEFMDPDYDPFIGLQGLNGALQRAINLSGINGGVNHPDLGDDGRGAGKAFDMVYSVRIRDRGDEYHTNNTYTTSGIGGAANAKFGGSLYNEGYKHSQDPAFRSHLDTEHMAGAPVGEAGQLLQGAPGFVTQGDLLAMIAPALTARGDTFLVRAYGDASEAGNVTARAWLEAVVQRVPEPVDPAGASGEDAWRPASSFGRRFKVVSVRWLTPEEI